MTKTLEQKKSLTAHFEGLAKSLYELGDGRDENEDWNRHKARVRGFQEAARVLQLMTLEDVVNILDGAHLEVFGESRQARRDRLDGPEAKAMRGEWDSFDSPAYERYRPQKS